MNITQINAPIVLTPTNNEVAAVETGDRGAAFGKIFDATIRMFENASVLEHEAEAEQISFITGESDDMLAVMLAEQRAQTAVTFTSQVTSKIMDAYRQIMNMQI